MRFKLIYILPFIGIFLFLPLVNAGLFSEKTFDNIDIEVRGPGIVSVGNSSLLIIQFYNLNKDTEVTIETVRVLNMKKETIKEFYIGKEIRPVGRYMEQIEIIMEKLPLFRHLRFAYASALIALVDKLQEGYYKIEGFGIDLMNFSKDSNVRESGGEVKIFVETDFSSKRGNFTLEAVENIIISEPVPLPKY